MKLHSIAAKVLYIAILFCCVTFGSYATTWTTITAGSINTLSNWTNGTSSPTTFATPGDTWNITMPMTMSSSVPWTVGTPASIPVNVTLAAGGKITGGAGGFQMILNIYGNISIADSIIANGGGAKLFMNVYGNYSQTAGSVDLNGGSCILVYNINGNFTMISGSVIASGGLAIDTFNFKGNFSMSGPSFLASNGGGAIGIVHLCLPSASGTMMIDNTSTGAWQANPVYIDTNCTAQLAGNFGASSSHTLTVNGKLICPETDTVVGTGAFTLNGVGTLVVGHATGINGAIITSGTKTFSTSANYGFNGTMAQVTGSYLPASLVDPDTIFISNSTGVTLSQATTTTGKLVFTSGILNTGTFTMSVPGAAASVTGAGLSSYVNGTLIKTISGLTSVNYEVGDLNYAPMLLTLSAAGTAGSLALKTANGLHPNVSTSGITSSYIANHYWTISNLGAAGPATVTPTATYNLADIIGGSNMYFHTQEYAGAAWLTSAIVSANTTSPYTTTPTTGIALASLAGDYIFGRSNNPALNLSSVSGAVGLDLFPNPNNGSFTMNITASQDEEVIGIVTDVVGRIIKELTAKTNKETEIKTDAAPGIYFLSVSGNSVKFATRFVIE